MDDQPRRRRRGRAAPAVAGKSEVFLPLSPKTLIRVRYVGPGGGALNLCTGGDIAVHVNPRPHDALLVLNSHFGDWGPEERPPGFPFVAGADTELIVRVEADHFLITASAAGHADPFTYRYAFRHPRAAALDRFTLDIPGVFALTVQSRA